MQHILEPGIILRERYEILELVGQGGMGAVYKTSDLRLDGRICAVKEILPALAGGATSEEELEQITEQFRTEASVLARLDHPNLPKVSDYFSMGLREYLGHGLRGGQGSVWRSCSETGRSEQFLREQQVLIWAAQMLDALEYLHSQDPVVLHRDIKPGNIKITPRGSVKLVDFGLVKVLYPDDSQTVTVVQGRGTVAYTPLEQYGSDAGYTDARTDLYSFGATLYHLLAGVPPLDAKERFLRPGSPDPAQSDQPRCLSGLRTCHLSGLGHAPQRAPGQCPGDAGYALWLDAAHRSPAVGHHDARLGTELAQYFPGEPPTGGGCRLLAPGRHPHQHFLDASITGSTLIRDTTAD